MPGYTIGYTITAIPSLNEKPKHAFEGIYGSSFSYNLL